MRRHNQQTFLARRIHNACLDVLTDCYPVHPDLRAANCARQSFWMHKTLAAPRLIAVPRCAHREWYTRFFCMIERKCKKEKEVKSKVSFSCGEN
jgi:hypothetical protein